MLEKFELSLYAVPQNSFGTADPHRESVDRRARLDVQTEHLMDKVTYVIV